MRFPLLCFSIALILPVLAFPAATAAYCDGPIVPVSVTPTGISAEFPSVHVEAVFQQTAPLCEPDLWDLRVDGRPPLTTEMTVQNGLFVVSGDFLLAPGPHVASAYVMIDVPGPEHNRGDVTWAFTTVINPGTLTLGGSSQPVSTPPSLVLQQVTVGPISVPSACAVVVCVGPGPEILPATTVPSEETIALLVYATLTVTLDPVIIDNSFSAVSVGPQTVEVPTPLGPLPITICPSGCTAYLVEMENSAGLHVSGTVTILGTPYPVDVPVTIPL